jgi:hypothetical protein
MYMFKDRCVCLLLQDSNDTSKFMGNLFFLKKKKNHGDGSSDLY